MQTGMSESRYQLVGLLDWLLIMLRSRFNQHRARSTFPSSIVNMPVIAIFNTNKESL